MGRQLGVVSQNTVEVVPYVGKANEPDPNRSVGAARLMAAARLAPTLLAGAFDYIERFYNPTRRHPTLGYLSPMDFERQAQVA